jgi:hypothetical protein
MSEFDPDEMVQFYGKLQTLSHVVHEIMRQPPHRRAVVNVFRVGKESSVLRASEIEDIAKLPAFKVAPDQPRAEDPPSTAPRPAKRRFGLFRRPRDANRIASHSLRS